MVSTAIINRWARTKHHERPFVVLRNRRDLTHALLLEQVHYDPETGVFTRRKTGKACGRQSVDGYIYIVIKGCSYKAHRLAWFYVHGSWPIFVIDHINRDRADNRIVNLRDVPQSINAQNRECRPRYGYGRRAPRRFMITKEMVEDAALELLLSMGGPSFPRDWDDAMRVAERVLRRGINAEVDHENVNKDPLT